MFTNIIILFLRVVKVDTNSKYFNSNQYLLAFGVFLGVVAVHPFECETVIVVQYLLDLSVLKQGHLVKLGGTFS